MPGFTKTKGMIRGRVPVLLSALSAPLVLVFAVACSAKKEGSGAANLSDVAAFCGAWAQAACSDAVVDACQASSREACENSQRAFCAKLFPKAAYSAKNAATCIDAVQSAYEDAVLTADERDTVLSLGAPCDVVASGPAEDDESCTKNSDCNRDLGLTCVLKTPDQGTCQIAVEVGGGESCAEEENVCAAEFHCDGKNCIKNAAPGKACDESTPCTSESQCLTSAGEPPSSSSPEGTCVRKIAVREEGCHTDAECESRICTPRVGSETGVCADKILLSPSSPICGDLS